MCFVSFHPHLFKEYYNLKFLFTFKLSRKKLILKTHVQVGQSEIYSQMYLLAAFLLTATSILCTLYTSF